MAVQDEIVIDPRSRWEKVLNLKKVAAHNIKIGLDATIHGIGVSARAILRNGWAILAFMVAIAASVLLIAVVVMFYVWLFHVAPVVFWLLIAFKIFSLLSTLLQYVAS